MFYALKKNKVAPSKILLRILDNLEDTGTPKRLIAFTEIVRNKNIILLYLRGLK